jgi:hypothetical protein
MQKASRLANMLCNPHCSYNQVRSDTWPTKCTALSYNSIRNPIVAYAHNIVYAGLEKAKTSRSARKGEGHGCTFGEQVSR